MSNGFAPEILFHEPRGRMLDAAHPQAVAIFTSTYDHPQVVEACAARGVHVMMEKPLAVSMAHARRIADAAGKGNIQVLVNYETTWYASNRAVYDAVKARHARARAQDGRARRASRSPGDRRPAGVPRAGSPTPSSTAAAPSPTSAATGRTCSRG